MTDTIISRCEAKGLRMTAPRRTIARVLEESELVVNTGSAEFEASMM